MLSIGIVNCCNLKYRRRYTKCYRWWQGKKLAFEFSKTNAEEQKIHIFKNKKFYHKFYFLFLCMIFLMIDNFFSKSLFLFVQRCELTFLYQKQIHHEWWMLFCTPQYEINVIVWIRKFISQYHSFFGVEHTLLWFS